ncbi:MAG: hypothetical protein ABIR51_09225 [Sphingomicrobium sp.]
MIRGLSVVAVMALAASGCDKPAEPAAQAPKVAVRSPDQDRLFKMSELDRAIGLKRAIYESGSTCKRVTETRFIGPYKNMDMWAVRCADKRDWALFIGADNSVQVRLCKDTEAVGLPSCKLDKTAAKPPAS